MSAAHVPQQLYGGNLDTHKVMGATHIPWQCFGSMLGAHNIMGGKERIVFLRLVYTIYLLLNDNNVLM